MSPLFNMFSIAVILCVVTKTLYIFSPYPFIYFNPASRHVYIHDTNVKFAFFSNRRFLSHGCMRIEKPFELAVALVSLLRK